MAHRSLILLFASFWLHSGLAPAQPRASSLQGEWRCQMLGETVSLIFLSESMLEFDGEPAAYRLAEGTIVVQDEFETMEYAYRLHGDALSLFFPEGFEVKCTRSGRTSSRPTAPAAAGAVAGRGEGPSASPPRSAAVETTPEMSAGEVGDAGWGFKFPAPKGWKWRSDYSGAILGHDTIPGMILVSPHRENSLRDLASSMEEGLTEEGVDLRPSGPITPTGSDRLSADYTGVFQGQPVKGKAIGTLSPYGGGAYVLGVTTPDKYDQGIAGAAVSIATSLRYFKVEVSELARHFAGMWAHYSGGSGGGTLVNYDFYPDGTFSDTSETSYSSQYSSDGWGTPDTSLGAVGVTRGRARWTVRGNLQRGQIIITQPDGTERTIDYQVFVEKGRTYTREYLFNGRHFAKKKDY